MPGLNSRFGLVFARPVEYLRSRTRRPGSLQEQLKHSMARNVEPPVLASAKLANGETVYVELSPEGQRKMSVVAEGTMVQLANGDVAARHRDDKGIKWMSLNRLERLRRAEGRRPKA